MSLRRWNNGEKSRKFVISSGVGLDAIVCKKALTSKIKKFLNKIHLGKLTYIVLTVQTLFSMDTFNGKAKIDGTEKNYGLCVNGGGVGIYVGGHPLDENGTEDPNKKLLTPLHYRDGDSITLRWTGTGYITSANTVIHFCIPISKIIPSELKVTASEVTIKVRQADGYRFGSSSSTYVSVKDEQVSASIDKTDGNYVRMAVTL